MEVPWCISCYKSHRIFNKSCIVYSVYEGGGAALVEIIKDTRFVTTYTTLITSYTNERLPNRKGSLIGNVPNRTCSNRAFAIRNISY